MKLGLVGRPKTGKTTLFNLLTGASVATSRFDSGRAELHTGVARVPDPRVDRLSELFRPRKTTYASFEVVDLAGFAKGERTGLDAKEFRDADALLHVVRGFADPVLGPPDPKADVAELEMELLLADLEVVERRLERLEGSLKRRRVEADAREQALLQRVREALEAETPLRALELSPDDARTVRGFMFLSRKPILHCVNLDEQAVAEGERALERFGLQAFAGRPHTRLGWVSAPIEGEVAQLEGEDQRAFLTELGLREPALPRLLGECYQLLGLISFFTTGDDEVRAWTIPAGTRAQDAAGAVHSDMARGFIRAEVVSFDDIVAAGGSWADLRALAQVRLEGKDYIVQDGEVCHFRFNVGKG